MEQAVYRLLTLNKNAAMSAYRMLKRIKGLKCRVFKPQVDYEPRRQYEPGRNGSIFGLEGRTDYDDNESYEDTLLIFNVFQEGYAGYDEFDTFTTNTFCLTTADERLPLQTEIEVNFYGKKMWFKVDDHKTLSPSVVEQLFIKNVLVPAT